MGRITNISHTLLNKYNIQIRFKNNYKNKPEINQKEENCLQ